MPMMAVRECPAVAVLRAGTCRRQLSSLGPVRSYRWLPGLLTLRLAFGHGVGWGLDCAGITADGIDDLEPAGELADVLVRDADRRRAVLQDHLEFAGGPEELLDEGAEAAAARLGVVQDLADVRVTVSLPAHGSHGQVQISEAVGAGVQVAPEDGDLGDGQQIAGSGVVRARSGEDLPEVPFCRCPGDWLAEARLGERVARHGGDPLLAEDGDFDLSSPDEAGGLECEQLIPGSMQIDAEYLAGHFGRAIIGVGAHQFPGCRCWHAADHVSFRNLHSGSSRAPVTKLF